MLSNINVYRIDKDWPMTDDRLDALLSKKPFVECSGTTARSIGWVPPMEGKSLVLSQERQWLFSAHMETKTVPSDEVKREVALRAEKVERESGSKPGRKMLREIKEQVIFDLLPNTFGKHAFINVWINKLEGLLFIDTSSTSKADDIISLLVETIPDFPISRINTTRAPATVMASWISEGAAPDGFELGRLCEIHGSAEDKAKIKYTGMSLDNEELRQHIGNGMLPSSTALSWQERVMFVLTEKLQIKKISFADHVMDEVGNEEDAEAIFYSKFAIMTSELTSAVKDLIQAIGEEVKE